MLLLKFRTLRKKDIRIMAHKFLIYKLNLLTLVENNYNFHLDLLLNYKYYNLFTWILNII